jgi:hypothetical protein
MAGASARAANAAAPALPVCCCWTLTNRAGGGSRCCSEGHGFIAAHRRARDNGWGAGARAIWGAKSE